jgi:hypothetical protein
MKKLMLTLALALLGACASMKTSWDYDPAVNFGQFKTYAWVSQKADAAGYHLDGLMDSRVRTAVEVELAHKGMMKVDAASADMLVNYLTKIDKQIDVDTFNTHYGYNPYHWGWAGSVQTQTVVREYEVGTLIVDLVDNKSSQLVWRGSFADTVRDNKPPQEKERLINQAVASIMMNYPPKPGSN